MDARDRGVPRAGEGRARAAGERDRALLLRAGRGGAGARRPRRGARAPARGAHGGAALSARRAGARGHRDRAARLRARRAAARRGAGARRGARDRGGAAARAPRARGRRRRAKRRSRASSTAAPDAVNEVAIASIMADALDFAPLEERVRACLAQDDAIAGLVRAIGRDPAALDARAVADIAAVLRRLAARTPRYRCANCGFSSIDHFWQCPGLQDLGQPAAAASLRPGGGARGRRKK